jgi:hypothetical protein
MALTGFVVEHPTVPQRRKPVTTKANTTQERQRIRDIENKVITGLKLLESM